MIPVDLLVGSRNKNIPGIHKYRESFLLGTSKATAQPRYALQQQQQQQYHHHSNVRTCACALFTRRCSSAIIKKCSTRRRNPVLPHRSITAGVPGVNRDASRCNAAPPTTRDFKSTSSRRGTLHMYTELLYTVYQVHTYPVRSNGVFRSMMLPAYPELLYTVYQVHIYPVRCNGVFRSMMLPASPHVDFHAPWL